MNVLNEQHNRRCASKQHYRRAELADAAAQRASKRTGDLVISYRCFDCGWWHIGHADASQIAARQPVVKPLCVVCYRPIPDHRRKQARLSGNSTTTCSKHCARRLKRQRQRQAARAASEDGSKGSLQPPA